MKEFWKHNVLLVTYCDGVPVRFHGSGIPVMQQNSGNVMELH